MVWLTLLIGICEVSNQSKGETGLPAFFAFGKNKAQRFVGFNNLGSLKTFREEGEILKLNLWPIK